MFYFGFIALWIITIYLIEGVLAFLRFPIEQKIVTLHPPHYRELRRTSEFQYEFKTDSLGLRDREFAIPKPKGTYRIGFLGDSYTEGWGVSIEDRFTRRIQNKMRSEWKNVEMVNLGIANTGTVHQAWILKELVDILDFNAVVLCFFANDVSNAEPGMDILSSKNPTVTLQRSGWRKALHFLWPRLYTALVKGKNNLLKKRYSANIIEFVEKEAAKKGISREDVEAWKNELSPEVIAAIQRGEHGGIYQTYSILRPTYWTDAIDIDTPEAEVRWQMTKEELNYIRKTCLERNIDFSLIFLPMNNMYEFVPPEIKRFKLTIRPEWLTEETEIQRRLAAWAQEQNTPFLDLTEAFRQSHIEYAELHYFFDGHWTPKGHELAANTMYEWFKRNKALSIFHE